MSLLSTSRSRTGLSTELNKEGLENDLGPTDIDEVVVDDRTQEQPDPTDYTKRADSVAFTAQNIGGSNETDRVRTLVYMRLYSDVRITATGDIGSTPRTLNAEYYDDILVAWTDLGAFITASSTSATVDNLDSGVGAIVPDAIEQGWCWVRITFDGDASDDIFGLHAVFMNNL